eukprot:TRINITY_DN14311_c0_g1_i1.p2 TRINITY_DN14311_c0_g1~~TRINITY_DN14311_c0_g1_i1.p2  ORF type:complete len:202 (+),score=43.98 TRINITY_DN14311_c0_g1_i1:1080-1685(+)
MDENISNNSNINIKLDAGENKIKYYENNDVNCIFEILETDKEENQIDSVENSNTEHKMLEGEIIVISVLDCGKHEYLKGAKINLYKINGLSPILIDSKLSDEAGKVVFKNIEEGCYRIIEIIDKRYFEKPKYVNWNEIVIDADNLKQKVLVVNRLKNNKLIRHIKQGTFNFLVCLRRCNNCLLYTSPSPRDRQKSRMPSSA